MDPQDFNQTPIRDRETTFIPPANVRARRQLGDLSLRGALRTWCVLQRLPVLRMPPNGERRNAINTICLNPQKVVQGNRLHEDGCVVYAEPEPLHGQANGFLNAQHIDKHADITT